MRGRAWAYLGAVLGGSVSVAANIAHCYIPPTGAPSGWTPQTGAVALSALWPVMVLVAVEILGRVAWPAGWRWWVLRWGGLTPVTAVAAVVSYRHLSGLLASYGEDAVVAVIGPLAIDGLMVISSAALLSLSVSGQAACPDTVSRLCVSGHAASADEPSEAPVTVVPEPVAGGPGDDPETLAPALTRPLTEARTGTPDPALAASQSECADALTEACTPALTEARTPALTEARTDEGKPARRRPGPDTRTRVMRLHERHPEMSASEVARKVDRSVATVRRYFAETRLETAADDAPPVSAEPVKV
jgi:hypothetical protein